MAVAASSSRPRRHAFGDRGHAIAAAANAPRALSPCHAVPLRPPSMPPLREAPRPRHHARHHGVACSSAPQRAIAARVQHHRAGAAARCRLAFCSGGSRRLARCLQRARRSLRSSTGRVSLRCRRQEGSPLPGWRSDSAAATAGGKEGRAGGARFAMPPREASG